MPRSSVRRWRCGTRGVPVRAGHRQPGGWSARGAGGSGVAAAGQRPGTAPRRRCPGGGSPAGAGAVGEARRLDGGAALHPRPPAAWPAGCQAATASKVDQFVADLGQPRARSPVVVTPAPCCGRCAGYRARRLDGRPRRLPAHAEAVGSPGRSRRPRRARRPLPRGRPLRPRGCAPSSAAAATRPACAWPPCTGSRAGSGPTSCCTTPAPTSSRIGWPRTSRRSGASSTWRSPAARPHAPS